MERMNGYTNISLSWKKFFKIEIIVKMLFKIVRRRDPIELYYKLFFKWVIKKLSYSESLVV